MAFPGFVAVGLEGPPMAFPGFSAAGVEPQPATFPGFAAEGMESLPIAFPSFVAAGVSSTSGQVVVARSASTLPPKNEALDGAPEDTATKRVSGRVARKQPSAPPVVDGASAPPVAACAAGCFAATVSGARPATFDGPAAAEVSDGSRYSVVLRDKADEGHYIALHRMEGGIPGAGTFTITNTCGEAGYTADQRLFQVEYYLKGYRNEEKILFVGKSGTVTIESIEGEHARGRYDIIACRELGEGKLEMVHLRGTFDVPR